MRAAKTTTAHRPQPRALLPSLALPAAIFVVGLVAGWLFGHQPMAPGGFAAQPLVTVPPSAGSLVRLGGQGLIHKLLYCDVATPTSATSVRAAVQTVLDRAKAAGHLRRAAVSFLELESGAAFAIDGDMPFRPASLLKLPVAMAWMRKATADPTVLNKSLLFDLEHAREDATAEGALERGHSYTVADLVERALKYSRNDAKAVLVNGLPESDLREVYASLGVPWPYHSDTSDSSMSVNQYAKLFRTLYDASWLGPAESERLLKALTATQFRAGLPAGVPPSVQVAHKWGRRLLPTAPAGEQLQLHDCGIVYKPGNPWLLCVMTAGSRDDQLQGVIADLARQVFNATP